MASQQQFHVILVKPSHYDGQGYVVQRVRSNSLAVFNGLALDCWHRTVLGEHVALTPDSTESDEMFEVPMAHSHTKPEHMSISK
ncbi:MAG TPA: hypothetical protein VKR82_08115 [Candidatus Acidoferrales bacterium]|nr:hypothetical protein [Candidatus Acidoferrales bacterium]